MNEGILQNEDLPNTETEQALMTGEREREKEERGGEERGREQKQKKIERVVYNRQELSKWCLT